MTLVRWKPRHLTSLPPDIDRFFEDFGFGWKHFDRAWSPSVDLSETDDKYEVAVDLPGMKKDEIQIQYRDNVLKLSGEKKHEEKTDKKNYHRAERAHGRFERSFRLPKDVKAEYIKASYKDGVLHVEIPKAEEVKPKEIAVS